MGDERASSIQGYAEVRNGDDSGDVEELEPEQQGRVEDVGDGGGGELLGDVGIPARMKLVEHLLDANMITYECMIGLRL